MSNYYAPCFYRIDFVVIPSSIELPWLDFVYIFWINTHQLIIWIPYASFEYCMCRKYCKCYFILNISLYQKIPDYTYILFCAFIVAKHKRFLDFVTFIYFSICRVINLGNNSFKILSLLIVHNIIVHNFITNLKSWWFLLEFCYIFPWFDPKPKKFMFSLN